MALKKYNNPFICSPFKTFQMNFSSLNSSMHSKDIFINYITKKGLKNTSEKLFKKSLKNIQRHTKKNSKIIIKLSLKNVYPVISFIKIKRNKSITSIPFFLKKNKRLLNTIKSLVKESFSTKNFSKNFPNELIQSSNNRGLIKSNSVKTHSTAFVNKKFSHYRWF